MVLKDCQFLKRLESINHYFFFDKGDFFSHFVDASGKLLENFTTEVKEEKMALLLDMAIRTSSA
jgi:hypothetical protein